jgi:hypothetical protein
MSVPMSNPDQLQPTPLPGAIRREVFLVFNPDNNRSHVSGATSSVRVPDDVVPLELGISSATLPKPGLRRSNQVKPKSDRQPPTFGPRTSSSPLGGQSRPVRPGWPGCLSVKPGKTIFTHPSSSHAHSKSLQINTRLDGRIEVRVKPGKTKK